jgi:hypothetical protein
LQDFLEAGGVIPLHSPPSCPGYNGAIEAAIGSLKKRTAIHAEEQGRGGRALNHGETPFARPVGCGSWFGVIMPTADEALAC